MSTPTSLFHIENHTFTRDKILSVHHQISPSSHTPELSILTESTLFSNCQVQSNGIAAEKTRIDCATGFINSIALSNEAFIVSRNETKRKYWIQVEEFEYRQCFWMEKLGGDASSTSSAPNAVFRKLVLPQKERYEYITQAVELTLSSHVYVLMATNLGKLYCMNRRNLSQIHLVRSFDCTIHGLHVWNNHRAVHVWIYLETGQLLELRSWMSALDACVRRTNVEGSGIGSSSESASHAKRSWSHPFRFITNAYLPHFQVLCDDSGVGLVNHHATNAFASFAHPQHQPLRFIYDPCKEDTNAPPCAWSLLVSSSRLFHGPITVRSEDNIEQECTLPYPPSTMQEVECLHIDSTDLRAVPTTSIVSTTERESANDGNVLDHALTLHHIIISVMEPTGIHLRFLAIPPRLVLGEVLTNGKSPESHVTRRIRNDDVVLDVPLHSKQMVSFVHSGHFLLTSADENQASECNKIFYYGACSLLEIRIANDEDARVWSTYLRRAIESPTTSADYYFQLAYECAPSDYVRQTILRSMAQFYFRHEQYQDCAQVLSGVETLTIEKVINKFLSPRRGDAAHNHLSADMLPQIKALRNYLLMKASFKRCTFPLIEFPQKCINKTQRTDMTNMVVWILDLFLLEEHLGSTIDEVSKSELRDFIRLIGQLESSMLDVVPCHHLLLNRGYHREALHLAEKHHLSKELVEYHIMETLQRCSSLPYSSDARLFALLTEVRQEYCNPPCAGEVKSTHPHSKHRDTILPLVKQCCNNDPVRLIDWIHYSAQKSTGSTFQLGAPMRTRVSDLISVFPLVSPQKSSPELLNYFEQWSFGDDRTNETARRVSSYALPVNERNQPPQKHSCAAALVCIKEYLGRSHPGDILEFLNTVEHCTSCLSHILREVTSGNRTHFCQLHVQRMEEVEVSQTLHTLYNQVNCMHIAALCYKSLNEWQLAVHSLVQAASRLIIEAGQQNLPHVDLERRCLLALAAKFANTLPNVDLQDKSDSEAEIESHDLRERLWNLLLDEYEQQVREKIREAPTSKRILASFASDLASFLVVPSTSSPQFRAHFATPLSIVTRITTLLPSETATSAIKTNVLEYCQTMSQEMRDIKAEAEAHAALYRELKEMASSHTHSQFQVELKGNVQCCWSYCEHGNGALVDRCSGTFAKAPSVEPVFVYTFSCGHHFHSTCIEHMILANPSHEEIIRAVDEEAADIRMFPVRHSLTKLTLQQLNRRMLFFERAAEYARQNQSSWLKSGQKQQHAIFKRCLKQMVILAKKHQLLRHECPVCGGLHVASISQGFGSAEQAEEWRV